MKSGWELSDELATQHEGGSSVFLKLTGDGDRAVVVFVGEPFPFQVCFLDNRYQAFDGELKAAGHKPSARFAINVALYESKEVKIWEMSPAVYRDVRRVLKKCGPDRSYEIQRHGAPRDMKTTYSILPETQLTPERLKEFHVLKLHDLEAKCSGGTAGANLLGSYDSKSNGVIAADAAEALASRLKAMPREAVDNFCKKFSVTRIKDLPSAQLEKARAFVDVLASEFVAANLQSIDGTDPF